MSASARGMSFLRRGWNEIPDVIAGTAFAIFGIAMGGIGLLRINAYDLENRRYKTGYVVMRPDDPRAAKVHKD